MTLKELREWVSDLKNVKEARQEQDQKGEDALIKRN